MNDAERLLRGKHIVEQAEAFERIDLTVERIHGLFARAYYDLRELAEHGRDEARLAELRPRFDRTYLALRDVTSGFLRLEQAHDRLFELMGDDEVRTADARREAERKRRHRERLEREEEEARMRRGFRRTRQTPATPQPRAEEEPVDATVMAGFNASDVEAALAAHIAAATAGTTAGTPAGAPATPDPLDVPTVRPGRLSTKPLRQQVAPPPPPAPVLDEDIEPTLKPGQLSVKDLEAALRAKGFGRPVAPALDDDEDDWDMATMKVSAQDVERALKERGFE